MKFIYITKIKKQFRFSYSLGKCLDGSMRELYQHSFTIIISRIVSHVFNLEPKNLSVQFKSRMLSTEDITLSCLSKYSIITQITKNTEF